LTGTRGRLPFVDLQAQRRRLGGRIEAAIAAVLDHGQFVMGPEVARLEQALAEHSGARHVISCASGTDALLLVLMAQGLGPGDAVFLPGFTFAASAEAVALRGATPVFVDVDPGSCNLDPASLEDAIVATRGAGVLSEDRAIPPRTPHLLAVGRQMRVRGTLLRVQRAVAGQPGQAGRRW
jgi:dTDP-4-amino-4,6-dideoxygalactose transaminase